MKTRYEYYNCDIIDEMQGKSYTYRDKKSYNKLIKYLNSASILQLEEFIQFVLCDRNERMELDDLCRMRLMDEEDEFDFDQLHKGKTKFYVNFLDNIKEDRELIYDYILSKYHGLHFVDDEMYTICNRQVIEEFSFLGIFDNRGIDFHYVDGYNNCSIDIFSLEDGGKLRVFDKIPLDTSTVILYILNATVLNNKELNNAIQALIIDGIINN
ncbi:hypothetical protein EZS27_010889 [termite gut metagenome]|uniref:Uncharacterized protein n=1 Tax=termite gut metagenome TaxID=433724 RepID=A0A5J4S680_9ZZZZ